MRFSDILALSKKEASRIVLPLLIVLLLLAFSSAFCCSVFVMAVNFRNDYYTSLDKSHNNIYKCSSIHQGSYGETMNDLSLFGFESVNTSAIVGKKLTLYCPDSDKSIWYSIASHVCFQDIDFLLSSEERKKALSDNGITAEELSTEKDSIWISDYTAERSDISEGDKIELNDCGSNVKIYYVKKIYETGEVLLPEYIIPFHSASDYILHNDIPLVFELEAVSHHFEDFAAAVDRAAALGYVMEAGDTYLLEDNSFLIMIFLLWVMGIIFATISVVAISNIFSVSVASRKEFFTILYLQGMRRRWIFAVFFLPFAVTTIISCAITNLINMVLFDKVISLAGELLNFKLNITLKEGFICSVIILCIFLLLLAFSLLSQFKKLSSKELAHLANDNDR